MYLELLLNVSVHCCGKVRVRRSRARVWRPRKTVIERTNHHPTTNAILVEFAELGNASLRLLLRRSKACPSAARRTVCDARGPILGNTGCHSSTNPFTRVVHGAILGLMRLKHLSVPVPVRVANTILAKLPELSARRLKSPPQSCLPFQIRASGNKSDRIRTAPAARAA